MEVGQVVNQKAVQIACCLLPPCSHLLQALHESLVQVGEVFGVSLSVNKLLLTVPVLCVDFCCRRCMSRWWRLGRWLFSIFL